MPSKRLGSTAMMARMASVGTALDNNSMKDTKQRVYNWLDENEDCAVRLLQFMEAGLVREMINKGGGNKLPNSCVRVGLVSITIKNMALKRINPELTHGLMKLAKKKDTKIIDKLLFFGSCWPKATGMAGGMAVERFFGLFHNRCDIVGDRLKQLEVSADGSVDWGRYGVYSIAKAVVDETDPEKVSFETVLLSGISEGTHVLHKFAGVAVSLATLGVDQKMDGSWSIVLNHHEESAQLSNGRRLKVDLWPDFKSHGFFEYDRNLMEKFPESQYNLKMGKGAQEEAAKSTKEANEAMRDACDKAKKAMLNAPTGVSAPAKKRRRAA